MKTLASPTPLADLTLTQIVEYMKGHYKKETVEIAKRFKFFKRVQQDKESLADYLAELRTLAKTCNFGNYLDTALCDQLVCGMRDQKTQKELLCIQDLTIAIATECAKAAETDTGVESRSSSSKPLAQTIKAATRVSQVWKAGTHRCNMPSQGQML